MFYSFLYLMFVSTKVNSNGKHLFYSHFSKRWKWEKFNSKSKLLLHNSLTIKFKLFKNKLLNNFSIVFIKVYNKTNDLT